LISLEREGPDTLEIKAKRNNPGKVLNEKDTEGKKGRRDYSKGEVLVINHFWGAGNPFINRKE